MTTPISVSVGRGAVPESSHLVHAVVADRSGAVASWGDARYPTMPRSAIKSIQLLPMIRSGAADAWAVSDDEIALAASSHGAESDHVARVRSWLDRIGCSEADLECGPTPPLTASAAVALHQSGTTPSAVHNCCSGKHTGFLTVARHLGVPTAGYLDPDHPVQQAVTASIEEMTGTSMSGLTPGIDGCGIPVWTLPLEQLATGMARLADPHDLPDDVADAARRTVAALTPPDRAWLVSGTGRAETIIAAHATEPIVSKGGAEGVFMGCLPSRGIGFACKAQDGSLRGVESATAALLTHLGAMEPNDELPRSVHNSRGEIVGQISVAIR